MEKWWRWHFSSFVVYIKKGYSFFHTYTSTCLVFLNFGICWLDVPNLVKRINSPIEIILFAIYIYIYRLSNPRSLSSYLWLSTFEELINPKARYTFSQENVFLLYKRILDCISSNTFLKRVNKILISFIFSSCFESDRRLRCSNFNNSSESVLFEAKVKNIVHIWKLAVIFIYWNKLTGFWRESSLCMSYFSL